MKYLYIYDDGAYEVCDKVGKVEIESVTCGDLEVIRFKDDNFEELNVDGTWTLVRQHDALEKEGEQ